MNFCIEYGCHFLSIKMLSCHWKILEQIHLLEGTCLHILSCSIDSLRLSFPSMSLILSSFLMSLKMLIKYEFFYGSRPPQATSHEGRSSKPYSCLSPLNVSLDNCHYKWTKFRHWRQNLQSLYSFDIHNQRNHWYPQTLQSWQNFSLEWYQMAGQVGSLPFYLYRHILTLSYLFDSSFFIH